LLWANGDTSGKNAKRHGCVCGDKYWSWCLVLLVEGFWAISEPWLKHNGETGVIAKLICAWRVVVLEKLGTGSVEHGPRKVFKDISKVLKEFLKSH
jgi:hypothetical protein